MTSDEQAIREVISTWHSATGQGDVDTVLTLMAEEVVFLAPGQEPMIGRKSFEDGLRKLLTKSRIESSGDVQEIGISGDLAYSWVKLNVKVVPLQGGEPNTRSGNAMSILKKQADGAWVVVRDANMLSAR